MRSGPGSARTILLFHIMSARPSKQPGMVGSTLGVYRFGLIIVSARTNKRHRHQALAEATLAGDGPLADVIADVGPAAGGMAAPTNCRGFRHARARISRLSGSP